MLTYNVLDTLMPRHVQLNWREDPLRVRRM